MRNFSSLLLLVLILPAWSKSLRRFANNHGADAGGDSSAVSDDQQEASDRSFWFAQFQAIEADLVGLQRGLTHEPALMQEVSTPIEQKNAQYQQRKSDLKAIAEDFDPANLWTVGKTDAETYENVRAFLKSKHAGQSQRLVAFMKKEMQSNKHLTYLWNTKLKVLEKQTAARQAKNAEKTATLEASKAAGVESSMVLKKLLDEEAAQNSKDAAAALQHSKAVHDWSHEQYVTASQVTQNSMKVEEMLMKVLDMTPKGSAGAKSLEQHKAELVKFCKKNLVEVRKKLKDLSSPIKP